MKLCYGLLSGFILVGTSAFAQAPWSYDGITDGQDMWGSLDPAYAACELGARQSPIVIGSTDYADLPIPKFRYVLSSAKLRKVDHTIEIVPEQTNYFQDGETQYQLKSIRFHSPSEHIILSTFYPLEIHLHHESAQGKKLTIAVFADTNKPLEGFDVIVNALPANASGKAISVNPASLLPDSFSHYRYPGSMSIPPCTEDVEWVVMKKPISISTQQLRSISVVTGRNARLEQPTMMRVIRESKY